MIESTADIEYHYRLMGVPEVCLGDILKVLKGLEIDKRFIPNDKAYILIFPILIDFDYSLFFNLFNQISHLLVEFGLFVSFTMYQDHDGIHMPLYVLDFYKETKGKIDISVIADVG